MHLAETALITFDQLLATLDHLLGKAAASEQGEALLQARLAPDMLPLATQVRFTTQQIFNTLNRAYGTDLSGSGVDHASFAEARAHVAEVRALIAEARKGRSLAEDEMVEFDLPNGMIFAMTVSDYVRDWSLPQFHFHLMTAYAILRQAGLPIGKSDFMGYMMQHLKAPPQG
ncbi:MAG: DUF1993 domain-containing protein [Sphingomonadaceae bacterium]|nr:DUF1993 domain-containing protein [Sphingomonadaceae bacterium]